MNRRFFGPLLLLLLCAGISTSAFGREAREQQRIDFLLHAIGSLPGAVFIRNGSEYDAKAAENHLKQKLDYGGEKLKTAEQFIEYCATGSSISGKPYKIRLADGKTVECAPYLKEKLAGYDTSHH